MADKDDRQAVIRQCVRKRMVRTQRELIAALNDKGFAVDQSTLSRDLAELSVRKQNGRYAVAPPPGEMEDEKSYAARVRRFTPCGPHLTVIVTDVGQAQPVALTIEALNESAIVGTLAGDDTVFLATKSRSGQAVALRRLTKIFGDKHVR